MRSTLALLAAVAVPGGIRRVKMVGTTAPYHLGAPWPEAFPEIDGRAVRKLMGAIG